jgi:hypothetical protein
MQRFTLTLEFHDLKPNQWTELRSQAEALVRDQSGGEAGLDDQVDGWDMGYWLFRLLLGGVNVMEILGEAEPVKAGFDFEDTTVAES